MNFESTLFSIRLSFQVALVGIVFTVMFGWAFAYLTARRKSVSRAALVVLLTATTCLYGCTGEVGGERTEVIVFTAISLKKPMTEIARFYQENNPDIKINLNYAGSGSLATQIAAGAQADVFISASTWDMDSLMNKGLIDQGTRRVLAGNWLVLVATSENPAQLWSFKDLATEKVKRIALGNPTMSASGVYAGQILAFYGINQIVKDKLIYCDQVAQIADYVIRKEADAGILFYTDYLTRKGQLSLIEEAPQNAHSMIKYPVAVVSQSLHPAEAASFIDWLYSDKSRAILAENGFRITVEVDK